MRVYHDTEWGIPTHDDRDLFERLILEGFQAGLSWRTILHKRENFRAAFDNFDAEKIAGYDEAKLATLMQDTGIIRNRLKIYGARQNAQAYLRLVEKTGSFSDWLWAFVGHQTLVPSVPLTHESRFYLCRANHLLRLYAKRGDGRRSCGRLFQVQRALVATLNQSTGKQRRMITSLVSG